MSSSIAFECWIKLNNGSTTKVKIYASDFNAAQQLAEAQYGYGNVINVRMLSEHTSTWL